MKVDRSHLPTVILVAVGGSFLGACWTTAADGASMRSRLTELEQNQASQREELETEIATAQTKVQELEDVLGRATKLVTRNSADTGAQVETLQQQMMAIEGQLAELRHEAERQQAAMQEQQTATDRQLKKLARHVGLDPTVDEASVPAAAGAHFDLAEQAYSGRQYSRARALYRLFVQRHGQDERVDNALLRVGTSFLEENRPATALGELRAVIDGHPQGDAADDALLGMAQAFYALHACSDARSALEVFPRAHPRSDRLAEARTLLRTVRRAPRSYCTR